MNLTTKMKIARRNRTQSVAAKYVRSARDVRTLRIYLPYCDQHHLDRAEASPYTAGATKALVKALAARARWNLDNVPSWRAQMNADMLKEFAICEAHLYRRQLHAERMGESWSNFFGGLVV